MNKSQNVLNFFCRTPMKFKILKRTLGASIFLIIGEEGDGPFVCHLELLAEKLNLDPLIILAALHKLHNEELIRYSRVCLPGQKADLTNSNYRLTDEGKAIYSDFIKQCCS